MEPPQKRSRMGEFKGLGEFATAVINELKKGVPMTTKQICSSESFQGFREASSQKEANTKEGKEKKSSTSDNITKRLSVVMQVLEGLALAVKLAPGYKQPYCWTGKVSIPNPDDLANNQKRLLMYQIALSHNGAFMNSGQDPSQKRPRRRIAKPPRAATAPADDQVTIDDTGSETEDESEQAQPPQSPPSPPHHDEEPQKMKDVLEEWADEFLGQNEPSVDLPFWLIAANGKVTQTKDGLSFSESPTIHEDMKVIEKVYCDPR